MIPAPPRDDGEVAGFVSALGLPGLVDVHVHFLPENILRKVWAYFDQAEEHYGTAWPVHYRLPEPDVADYLGAAVEAGARVVKVHVQVGGFDPRDPLLTPAWGLLAEAGLPAVVQRGRQAIPLGPPAPVLGRR